MDFNKLYSLNVNEHTEQRGEGKNALTYLSWTWAWAKVKELCPDATYTIAKFAQPDGTVLPYMYDSKTGYMVMTTVTIDGLTYEMWLPVMDGANKAMKDVEYTYSVRDYKNGGFIEKTVAPATMFDINKTIMRCLVKNLAMFGLGLYIYAGEDLPESEVKPKTDLFECADCGKPIVDTIRADGSTYTKEKCASASLAKFGRKMCADCFKKALNNSGVNLNE